VHCGALRCKPATHFVQHTSPLSRSTMVAKGRSAANSRYPT
jgi:hypothetical protein